MKRKTWGWWMLVVLFGSFCTILLSVYVVLRIPTVVDLFRFKWKELVAFTDGLQPFSLSSLKLLGILTGLILPVVILLADRPEDWARNCRSAGREDAIQSADVARVVIKRPTLVLSWLLAIAGSLTVVMGIVWWKDTISYPLRSLVNYSIWVPVTTAGFGLIRRRAWGWWTLLATIVLFSVVHFTIGVVRMVPIAVYLLRLQIISFAPFRDDLNPFSQTALGVQALLLCMTLPLVILLIDHPSRWAKAKASPEREDDKPAGADS
ncbi:MAG: hypothetical protein Q7T82_00135 [Armatimonadota bacterium]|nr:hypothetical protein [Armatimonadota bacterium]